MARGPTQLEERKSILEEGKGMIKNMSVVKLVAIFLGSGDPIPRSSWIWIGYSFSKNSFFFLLHVSKFYASLKIQLKSHVHTLSSTNNLSTKLFQH